LVIRIDIVNDITCIKWKYVEAILLQGGNSVKRSRDEIISQILDICTKGANKTQIVYKANLNFRTVNPYIDLLIKNNLIAIKDGQIVRYETTERGMNLLYNFNYIQDALSIQG
jgi:predicted transcriptional regulator